MRPGALDMPADANATTRMADRFAGCMLGLAIGDALGAAHEGGPVERMVWRLIGKTPDGRLRWTDDTQMALDLAESLLACDGVNPDHIAARFAASYRWDRGYGPGAAQVLKRIAHGQPWQAASKRVYAEGSFGNGAGMRAPVLALFFPEDRNGLIDAARLSASITHAHPLGIEGAVMIALAAQVLLRDTPAMQVVDQVRSACSTREFGKKLETVAAWLSRQETPEPRIVVRKLGNAMTAAASCPTALYLALRFLDQPFEDLLAFIIACGGDVDTLAAMAGALWGIANGARELPSTRIEAKERITDVASQLFLRYVEKCDSARVATAI